MSITEEHQILLNEIKELYKGLFIMRRECGITPAAVEYNDSVNRLYFLLGAQRFTELFVL